MSQTLDPTFYHSPADAIAAPPERLAYAAAFDPAGAVKDAVTVIGCDPSSPDYGKVVGWSELPTVGNELHHFGWNACSSALCHQGHGGHGTPLERRYLIVPGIRSSRTWLGGPAWLVPRAVARGAAGHAGPASPGTARPPVPRVAAGVAGRRRRVQPRHHHVPRGPASAAGAPSRPAGPAPPSGARPARPQAARSPRCPGKPRHSRQALVRRSTRAAGATRQSRALRTPLGIVGARRTGRQARLARRGANPEAPPRTRPNAGKSWPSRGPLPSSPAAGVAGCAGPGFQRARGPGGPWTTAPSACRPPRRGHSATGRPAGRSARPVVHGVRRGTRPAAAPAGREAATRSAARRSRQPTGDHSVAPARAGVRPGRSKDRDRCTSGRPHPARRRRPPPWLRRRQPPTSRRPAGQRTRTPEFRAVAAAVDGGAGQPVRRARAPTAGSGRSPRRARRRHTTARPPPRSRPARPRRPPDDRVKPFLSVVKETVPRTERT